MTDAFYMQRCLQLAQYGAGHAAPNPMVGSVIVHNGIIIGEGYHQKCGEAHAEVNAVASVVDKSLLTESTLYVSLEPCSHFGRTPPCSNLIIEHKIKRVVVGCIDSYSEVSGRGIERMRKAGIEVTVGVLEEESLFLNRRFFTFHRKKRPYIILKWAQTQDGYIDIPEEEKLHSRGAWITNDQSKQLVHKWRAEEASIMAGTNTIETDNPSLNIREWTGVDPVRIVPDRNLRLSESLNVFDQSVPTIVYTEKECEQGEGNLQYVTVDSEDFIQAILSDMYDRGITSLFLEGGSELFNHFIQNDLWDEARIFSGKQWFGGGVKAPEFNFKPNKQEDVDGVTLWHFNRV